MDLDTFRKTNTTLKHKGAVKSALGEFPPRKVAVFEHKGALYYAMEGGSYTPIFKLFGAGFKNINILTNYDVVLPADEGVLMLHGSKATKIIGKFNQNSDSEYLCTIRMKEKLAEVYPVPGRPGGLVSDIQAATASVKNDDGYETSGTHTVHRLYMATAYTILRKLHGHDRDGVVALVADKEGRVISWGRKNPEVPCWHGETSAIMRLGGKLPKGACVFSTLKPCNMCAGLIHHASGGDAKVYWGQDDPGRMAEDTVLEREKCGSLLDGNKAHMGARGIMLGAKGAKDRQGMAEKLGSDFGGQKKIKSTIDYIMTDEGKQIVMAAEDMLKNKHQKYSTSLGNEYTHAVIQYLVSFMRQLKIDPDSLGA